MKHPSITQDQIHSWRKVSAAHTRLLANACSRGVDFNGSSKGSIYRSFMKGGEWGYTVYAKEFAVSMDEAAKASAVYREAGYALRGRMLEIVNTTKFLFKHGVDLREEKLW